MSGGILTTTGNGKIRGINAGLADLTNNGSFVINDTNTTGISGTITNNGDIALNSAGHLTDLRFDNVSVTLGGSVR